MKKFSKILAMVMVALMMMSTAAFADAAIGDPALEEEVVTVQLTGLTANEEATILVVNDGVALASLKNTDIVYIDQLTADGDGKVTFTLDASNAVANEAGEKIVDIYCGYTNMNVAAGPLTCADLLINPAPEPQYKTGDADGDGFINSADLGTIINAILANDTAANLPRCDADGDGFINSADLGAVINIILAG